MTESLTVGSLVARASAGWVAKKDSSSSFTTEFSTVSVFGAGSVWAGAAGAVGVEAGDASGGVLSGGGVWAFRTPARPSDANTSATGARRGRVENVMRKSTATDTALPGKT